MEIFFSKHEYVSIRKLHVTLESKYKLWKTLYDLGFKYAKINGNKKALVERKNLAKNRIFFYVKLSKLPYATIISTDTAHALIDTIITLDKYIIDY